MDKIKKNVFGTLSNGENAYLYSIERNKITLCVTNYGCAITRLILKDKNDAGTDVVLGFETLDSYTKNPGSFGAIIGRYSNRINGASFALNGQVFPLRDNCEGSCLHGGFPRWEHTLWNAKEIHGKDKSGILFYKTFYDGEQGFPGNLNVEILYEIDDQNQLTMTYTAQTDRDTPISITNHTYFNLAGWGSILKNKLRIYSDRIVEFDKNMNITGKLLNTKTHFGGFFDFSDYKPIGQDMKLTTPHGYDDCYVTQAYDQNNGIPLEGKEPVLAAKLIDPFSGRKMTMYTNQEGIQFYTGKYINYQTGKYGAVYQKNWAVCLESQSFPDSPNQKDFPPVILHPGETYKAITIYKFSEV